MKSSSFQREIAVAVDAARRASSVIMQVYATDFAVDYKHAREPVTEADRRSNALLCEMLTREFPNDGLVAEESISDNPAEVAEQIRHERVWFVDPLDGTKEFLARNGEFAVMIGLAIRGRSTMGVVAMPTTNRVVVGVAGEGAWELAMDGTPVELRVSTVSDLAQSTLVLSRSHRPGHLMELVQSIPVGQRNYCGSVGVKASRLASKEADLYVYVHAPGGAKRWDACAPEAIVRGAGGAFTDLAGLPIDYAGPGGLEMTRGFVASNGLFHAQVIVTTQSAIE